MPTAAENIFQVGFRAAVQHAGSSYLFKTASFVGVHGTLRPDDPRLQGASGHLYALHVLTSELPSPAPQKGSTLTRLADATTHRVADRVDHPHGVTELLLTDR